MKTKLWSLKVAIVLTTLTLFSLSPIIARADQKTVADAKKTVTDADAGVKTAQKALDTAKAAVKTKLAATPEYVEAQDTLTKAKAAYDAAAKPVLDKVHASAEYKAAQKSFDDGDAKLKSLRSNPSAVTDTTARAQAITDANNAKTTAKKSMEQLEAAALAADPKVVAAKKAFDDAQAKVAELDKKLDPLVTEDEGCQNAQKELEASQAKLKEAQDALVQAQKQLQEESKNKHGGGNKKKGGGAAGAGAGAGGGK